MALLLYHLWVPMGQFCVLSLGYSLKFQILGGLGYESSRSVDGLLLHLPRDAFLFETLVQAIPRHNGHVQGRTLLLFACRCTEIPLSLRDGYNHFAGLA